MICNSTSASTLTSAGASRYAAPAIRAVNIALEKGFAYSTIIEGAPEHDYGDF